MKGQMMEKAARGFLKAEDIVDIVASPEMQMIFTHKGFVKPLIVNMGVCWLEKLGWTYGKLKNGIYLDGHKRDNVVEYQKAFIERWMGYEQWFHWWDNNGTELLCPNGFPVPGAIGCFCLILVTHDESIFFQNDECNTGWSHMTSKSKPKAKGNGQSLMVSDFLTPDWGCLHNGDEWVPLFVHHLTIILNIFAFAREAWVIFKAGRNCNGYFNTDDLLQQVDKAIDIFEGLTKDWAQGLFLFDNAPSHQRHVPDAISAWHMVKGAPHSLSPPLCDNDHCYFMMHVPVCREQQQVLNEHMLIQQALCWHIRGKSSGRVSIFADGPPGFGSVFVARTIVLRTTTFY